MWRMILVLAAGDRFLICTFMGSGATGTAQSRDLGNQRGKPFDITMTFGARGKQDATERAGWFDIRGGDTTGIALQGCLGGFDQAGG